MMKALPLVAVCLAAMSVAARADVDLEPTALPGLDYSENLLPGTYDPAIPTPESILGFPVGKMTATPEQIVEVVTAIAEASDRVKLFEYARSHEGRPLIYAVITTPERLNHLDEIKADLKKLSDPRNTTEAEAAELIERLPAVAWFANSIHGDESSGADSSLASIYHLAASTDDEVLNWLDKAVVIIDPSQNPDGRARFVKSLQEVRGNVPNIDDQSLLHTQYWPGGRYNHYLFDMNRDYIHGTQPETRGKVAAINSWFPQIVIDAHEMGAQQNYHFTPSREPLNFHFPPKGLEWNEVFAADQAAAFDARAWPYYNGEDFDDFYPGYTSYSAYRGAISILYEQASLSEDGVRIRGGRIETYQEATHHQLISTLTNLDTLVNNHKQLYRDWYADRKANLAPDGPYAQTFVVLPTDNATRLKNFVADLALQDIEIYTATADIKVTRAVDQLGQDLTDMMIPKGSLVIPNLQPEARIVAAMLEFEPQLREELLRSERQSLLRGDGTTMYDVTAWNLTMLHGLKALTVKSNIDKNIEVYSASPAPEPLVEADGSMAYVIDGSDDHAVSFAARAMERGLYVRAIDKAAVLDGRAFARGSIVVYANDNESFAGDWIETVRETAAELGLSARAIVSGQGDGDLPDIGGRHFRLLEAPRLAIGARKMTNPLDYGAIWHVIDDYLAIRHSHIDLQFLGQTDLRRYNVIVLPDMWQADYSDDDLKALGAWVEAGGTLIAIKSSAAALVDPEKELTLVRALEDSFDEAATYDRDLQREFFAGQATIVNRDHLWSNTAPVDVDYPQTDEMPDADTLKARDDWQQIFTPQGAIFAGRTDRHHWLTFGVGDMLPVLFGDGPVLMADARSDAVVRFGAWAPLVEEKGMLQSMMKEDEESSVRRIGWASLPEGQELRLRLSGLVWPEAAQRIANGAYLTREAKGNGQIILFADQPSFRASTLGTNRLLLNAIVFGPGLGADQPIIP